MIIADISKMSVQERLQAMEALWDSLSNETEQIHPPEWHEEILRERKQRHRNGKMEYISLDELKVKRKG
jgi:putative addiction module component (TIGR02574 family)